MMEKDINVHESCCYRENCDKDLEKCCYLQRKENKCIIGGCEK